VEGASLPLSKKNKHTRRTHFPILSPLLIVISATISAPADAIRLSADSLIVFENAIRIFTLKSYILPH